jgi:L-alanine-DL-glutamate epimerase-like enolase superfamily enzyme
VIGNSAISGIETACWDIHLLGVPERLLAGGRATACRFTHLGFGEMTPSDSLDEAPLVEQR